ncbi:MAG: hypothetical protein ACK50Q_07640 [Labrys sp. (in: a-proteobacteria)]|jgi:hypothetical protein
MPHDSFSASSRLPTEPLRAAIFARDETAARTARLAVGGAGPVEIDTFRWTDDCIAAVARGEHALVVVDSASIGLDALPFAIALRRAARAGLWLVLIGSVRASEEIKALIEAGYDAVLPLGEAGQRLTRFVLDTYPAPARVTAMVRHQGA